MRHDRYLCFSLGDESFALPLLNVREVLAQPEIVPVPHTPSYFQGLMNLRGQVVSVMDLRLKLGVKPRLDSSECVVIICALEGFVVGITVDAVNSVVAPKEEELSSEAGHRDYLAGVYRHGQELVLLLDVARALSLSAPAAA
ncbi:MAG: purine-binding chemotaxis protein CheW [Proteobacteria bacterium]|nr:MAG: purine-binding chemotaxis protein CheW [Pseudomonadota bacterium]